jgi:hypothetical protein
MVSLKRKRKARPVTAGSRVGHKRSDMRWIDPEGNTWASRFEYEVFLGIQSSAPKGATVARCASGTDSFAYTNPVRLASCNDCGSAKVIQTRTYTPDFSVSSEGGYSSYGAAVRSVYYIEAKGYLRAERRRLLRAFRNGRPDIDLRMVVERDYRVTDKLTLVQWARKYLKCPVVVWTGKLPEDW